MNKNKKAKIFLISSLIVLIVFFIGTMSIFSLSVGKNNNEIISDMGNIYMSGMSKEISMHFESIVKLQIERASTILNSVPDDGDYDEETLNSLIREGHVLGYDYLALMDSDGNFETIYGERIILDDPPSFVKSMNNGEKKVAIARKESDNDNDSTNDVIALGVSAEYCMKSGRRSTAIVASIPVSEVSAALSLDTAGEEVLTYSHVIRRDGSFIIRSANETENNYFDRIRDSYKTTEGNNIEAYINELRGAMERNEDYYREFFISSGNLLNERRALYCTHINNSEWYLVSIMPYSTINSIIGRSNTVQNALYTISLVIVVSVIVIIFIFYFRMTQNQLREMETARQEAMRASKAKSEFLSNMSHDIRTPMNAIVGMTAIAITHIDDTQQVQTCLKKISLSSKHLLGLINDILDMSKIESGKMTLNMDMVSLREVMDNIVNIVQPQVKAKKQNFDVSIHDIQNENVFCDSVRLNQVILNLLSNAIKFTPDEGNIETMLYQETSPKGDEYIRVHLRVRDNGIGMSPEFREKVFESFVREDNKRVHKTEGSGLGMAITKYIVDAMGGEIEVESEPGKGTEFHVVIDMEKATESEEKMILPNWKMLVVDDDKMLCQSAVSSLTEIGINADWTLNAENALDMVRENSKNRTPYDIILVDWKLPGMDGIEAARIIRSEMNSNVPIILISAYDWSEIEDKAREAGVTGFIAKPLFKSTLYHGLRPFSEQNGAAESRTAEEGGHRFDSVKVLLAEDNDLNWEIAYELLTPLGLDIDHAENGKVCVEMFRASPEGYYSVILMDIRMPIMSGLEASEAIRALGRSDAASIPIIAMTADAFSEDRQRCLNAGMNAHIAKPIDVAEVQRMIDKYVNGDNGMF
ncbi:MAG: response regulator [Ruminococcaceae bacterium]|nr:response regulator [Oscillospiraceae bacterium]